MFEYNGKVTRIIDGDTIVIEIDLGFDLKLKQIVRIYGINAPEISGEDKKRGYQAKDLVVEEFNNEEIIAQTVKPHDKYGRYLANIRRKSDNLDLANLLLQNDLAKAMIY